MNIPNEEVARKKTTINIIDSDSRADKKRGTVQTAKRFNISATEGIVNKLKQIQNFCSAQTPSTKPTLSFILDEMLPEIKDSDLKRIYENSLTSKDKLLLELEKYNKSKSANLSLEDFLCIKLKLN